jgi:glyoxylase-like metal-dependent hydrolase (beta-lactamase superfamily II)
MTEVKLGAATVQRIEESYEPNFDAKMFFPDWQPAVVQEHRDWLLPNHYDEPSGSLKLSVHSWLLTIGGKRILIDTCVGNHKERPGQPRFHMLNRPYMENFAKAGLKVEDVDYVLCTHLHVDHVGWNTRLDNGRWVPTFPKARYVFADRELAYWTKRQKDDAAAVPWVTDSVLPIVAANRADIVKSAHAFNDLVTLIPTPGHSIDHYSLLVGKPGADAVITGDMIHSPLQARYPELGMMSDYDSKQAGVSRRELFGRFCDTSTLMCTAHFPSPSTGRVVRWRDGFDIAPA